MLGIGKILAFGTGKHNFGYIPDPPEPEETECDGTYQEGSCECCDRFEECMTIWESDGE